MKVQTFKDLIVWEKSHNLVLEVYKITKTFPSEEKYGLEAIPKPKEPVKKVIFHTT